MTYSSESNVPLSSRRRFIAATTGLGGATLSGCTDFVGRFTGGGEEQVSLTILTMAAADEDRPSSRMARELRDHFETIGISAEIQWTSRQQLLESVLFEHDFECYIGQLPPMDAPDELYPLFHSQFANEPGWQNPTGYTNTAADQHLEDLLFTDEGTPLEQFLDVFIDEVPVIPVCQAEEYRSARVDQISGWNGNLLDRASGYLGLAGSATEFQMSITTNAPTINLNPFAAVYQGPWPFQHLIYDSLVLPEDSSYTEWMATTVTREETTIELELRSDLVFHDGQPVTAADVIFTYDLISDITLGQAGSPLPAPVYRWVSHLLTDVSGSGRTVSIGLRDVPNDWWRILSVPIVPKHIWESELDDISTDGVFDPNVPWSDALDEDIPEIGSGPYQLTDRSDDESLTLTRFEDHFSREIPELPEASIETLQASLDPNQSVLVEQLQDGTIDIVGEPFGTRYLSDLEAAGADDNIEVLPTDRRQIYHVGFNTRERPFSNWRFRRAVTGLLDFNWIVDEVFHGRADPVATPLPDNQLPEDSPYRWRGSHPGVEFYGPAGTNQLDIETAEKAFIDAGYRYDEDDNLVIFE